MFFHTPWWESSHKSVSGGWGRKSPGKCPILPRGHLSSESQDFPAMCRPLGLRAHFGFWNQFCHGGCPALPSTALSGDVLVSLHFGAGCLPPGSPREHGNCHYHLSTPPLLKPLILDSAGKQEANTVLWNWLVPLRVDSRLMSPMLARHALLLKIISEQDLKFRIKNLPLSYGSFQAQTACTSEPQMVY